MVFAENLSAKPIRMAKTKKNHKKTWSHLTVLSAGDCIVQLELKYTLVEYTTLENCLAVSSEDDSVHTVQLSNSTPTFIPKRNESMWASRDTSKNVPSSTICNSLQMETTQISTEERINKLQYIYTMNKLWQTTATQTNLTKRMLSKMSQTQKNLSIITLVLQNLKTGKTNTWF